MIAKDTIFREYDIRGVVGTDFDEQFAHQLGKAFATMVRRNGQKDSDSIAVGWDCRLSGPALSQALIEGLISGGMNVLQCGMGPTPQLYFSVLTQKQAGGIQVTGSHNPGDQNGFKMMIGKKTLSGGDIQELKKLVQNEAFDEVSHSGKKEIFNARSAYIDELVERSKPFVSKERKLKVVVDGGNGVGGLVGPEVLRRLGVEVIELYTEPDGRFPNHHPDPTVLENIRDLQKMVIQEQADFGVAWDGDADRIGVVDEKGEPIFGDMLLIIYGKQLLKEIKEPIIIGDVKCSDIMFSYLRSCGAQTVMWKTGHSLIKAKLQELDAHLAGEMSGHMFFRHRFFGFDDALHATSRLVEIVSHSAQTVSEMLADLPKAVSTPEIRRDCNERVKFQIIETAKSAFSDYKVNTLDGVRLSFPHGWGLVRASNTQPALVMRFEADTVLHLNEYKKLVEDVIDQIERDLEG